MSSLLPALVTVALLLAISAVTVVVRGRRGAFAPPRHPLRNNLPATDESEFSDRLRVNKEWAAGRITCSARSSALMLGGVAVIWNMIGWLSTLKTLSNPLNPSGKLDQYGVLILPLIGLGFAYAALRALIRWRKFGVSACEIRGRAGRLGDEVTGLIRTSQDLKTIGDYTLYLRCAERTSQGTGKMRRTQTTVLWEVSSTVRHLGQSSRSGIPFTFRLPAECPESDDPQARGRVSWSLELRAPVEGVDFQATFIIPVFRPIFRGG